MDDADRAAELFQLDDATCLGLLASHRIGRLVVPGDDPYVVPVTYAVARGMIVVRTERRPVIDAIADQPVVFEVDAYDERLRSGWSVVVRGCARLAADGSGGEVEPWAPGERACVVTIDLESMTGRLLRGAVDSGHADRHGYL